MRRAIVALLSAAILAATVPTSAAFAGFGPANCSDLGQVNRWRGHAYQNAAQKHGASATAEGQALVQCLNPGLIEISGAFYFTNITPNNGGFNDIVQIGMGTCRAPNCVAGMRYYSGWGRTKSTPGCSAFSNRAPTATDEGAWSSASHEYKVFHQANEWKLLVDGTKLLGVPEASICWTPSQAVWFAESWDFGDQIGGVDTNRFLVTSLKYANAEGGAFQPTALNAANACNYGGAGNPFFCDITGATSLSMWTNR